MDMNDGRSGFCNRDRICTRRCTQCGSNGENATFNTCMGIGEPGGVFDNTLPLHHIINLFPGHGTMDLAVGIDFIQGIDKSLLELLFHNIDSYRVHWVNVSIISSLARK